MGAGPELMKMDLRCIAKTQGSVALEGKICQIKKPADALAQGIVYISEDRKRDGLVLGMSVKRICH